MRVIAADPGDAAELRDLHVETWAATYRDLLPQRFYRERLTAHQRRDWAELVRGQAAAGGEVLIVRSETGVDGLCQYGPTEDDDDDPRSVGHIHRLYIRPSRQRAGIGRSLLAEATRRMRDSGARELTVWALERDPNARAFYERLGWQADGKRRFDGATDVRYRLSTRDRTRRSRNLRTAAT